MAAIVTGKDVVYGEGHYSLGQLAGGEGGGHTSSQQEKAVINNADFM